MTKITTFSSETLEVLEKSIFSDQSIKDTVCVMEEVFFDAIASEYYGDTKLRNKALVTYKLIRKALTCIQSHQHPDSDLVLEIKIDL